MAILAPSLMRARAVIDHRWPHRDRTSDGWIGDTAHQGRTSDHNPNSRGIVDAIDVDMFGGPTAVIRAAIVAAGMLHPAVNYVIFNRRIYQRSDQFRPRVYNGINPHDKHCHYSISQTSRAEQDMTAWYMLGGWPTWETSNLRKGGDSGWHVQELQALLNAWGASLAVDGDFGSATDDAVRAYQARYCRSVDGIVGPETRLHLFS